MKDNIKTLEFDQLPSSLCRIKRPPKRLYYQGEFEIREKFILGVVGTRKCTPYGKSVCIKILNEILEYDFLIVSGLAKGIDALAHITALKKHKRTFAILGTGVDFASIYPRENVKLAKEIIQNQGAIISEYPPKTKAQKFFFPERNRLIAGLADAILVIEAPQKSGALITAEYAFSFKKPVFTIPGSIYWKTFQGNHFLVKRGAHLIDSGRDILKVLKIPLKEKKVETLLNEEERLIIQALQKGPLHIDKIIEITKLEANKVISLLSRLELEGKIQNLGANIYSLL